MVIEFGTSRSSACALCNLLLCIRVIQPVVRSFASLTWGASKMLRGARLATGHARMVIIRVESRVRVWVMVLE